MSGRRALFLLIVTVVFGAVLVYPPLRFWSLLLPTTSLPWLAAIALFATPFIVRFIHEHKSNATTRVLSATVLTWIGISFLGLVLLIPVEILLALGLPQQPTATFALVVLGALASYALYNAHPLHIHELEIQETRAASGKHIAQISDLHIGSRQPGLLRRVVSQTQVLQPDYVVLTGDIIDMRGITEEHLAPLKTLGMPVVFCIGNHERYVDLEDICARLRNVGVHVLRNECLEIDDIQFIGIDDAEARDQVKIEIAKLSPNPDKYKVLLYHRPDGAEDAARWGAQLMLTGHTHRGQIVPFNYLVKRVFPRLYRDYAVDGLTLYVSPGTGTWGPVMRLGSKCEITSIRLL